MPPIKAFVQRRLPRSGFARAVGMLVGGTAVAQIITIAALPVLTRLYSPDDFAILAVYTSLLSILTVISCLRLDVAIPIPEEDGEAIALLKLSLIFTLVISVLAGVGLWAFGDILLDKLNKELLEPYIWLLPIGVLLGGCYSAVQYWSMRRKHFKAITQTKMAQAAGGTAAQLGFGYFGKLGPLGLIYGHILMSGLGIFKLGRYALMDIRLSEQAKPKGGLLGTLKKYEKFPKYSTLEAFANIAAIQLPILIIGTMAIGPEAGYLMLAMKASALPLGVIGGAVSQVYLSQAPEELRAGRLGEFTAGIVAKLIAVGVGPLVAIGILAPSVMGFILGPEWSRTGEIVLLLTPWFIMQFISSPISMALHVTGNLKLALANQIYGFVLRVGLTLLAAYFFKERLVQLYALSGFLFYFVYFLVVMYVTGVTPTRLGQRLLKPIVYVLVWSAVSLAVALSINLAI